MRPKRAGDDSALGYSLAYYLRNQQGTVLVASRSKYGCGNSNNLLMHHDYKEDIMMKMWYSPRRASLKGNSAVSASYVK
jgi:hypothetical protein